MKCVIDTSGIAKAADLDSPSSKKHTTSPVYTDPELNTCVSSTTPTGEKVFSPTIFCDTQEFLGDQLCITVSEPFWVKKGDSRWMSPDAYCNSVRDFTAPQCDKRKFWEMLKLLHELPVLNKRCKNRLRTAEQVAALFKRKEFVSLWSLEAPDCLNTEALKCLVSSVLGEY